ncbi:hypothetical protein [Pandoraea commovens]|uniref:Uncharacterized protein n=1 Tax=Pandoraea commovens TaxID=2508289 RepID=A0ABY5QKV4_9BURK|nr:hypothetical protein [Pandoraea commovens]UVA81269.1 hypothetical protein NTU39_09810 [Pandoraea commovens]
MTDIRQTTLLNVAHGKRPGAIRHALARRNSGVLYDFLFRGSMASRFVETAA